MESFYKQDPSFKTHARSALYWIDFMDLCLSRDVELLEDSRKLGVSLIDAIRSIIQSGEQYDFVLDRCKVDREERSLLVTYSILRRKDNVSLFGTFEYTVSNQGDALQCMYLGSNLTCEDEPFRIREFARFLTALANYIGLLDEHVSDLVCMKMVTKLKELRRLDPAKARTNIIDMSWMRELYLAGKEAEKLITQRKTA